MNQERKTCLVKLCEFLYYLKFNCGFSCRNLFTMPLTREQISELKAAADAVIKQLFSEPNFLKTITERVSNEIVKNLKQQLTSYEKKVDKLESHVRDMKEAHKNDLMNLNDKIDLLHSRMSDSTVASQNPMQIISKIEEIKHRENNLLVFGIPEDTVDQGIAVEDVIRTIVPSFNIAGSRMHRLGRPSSGKNRPIKIIMTDISNHSVLIKSNKKLQAVDRFKNVYIKPDMTVMQREHLMRLRRELKERLDSGEQDCIIRYKNGFPFITKKN